MEDHVTFPWVFLTQLLGKAMGNCAGNSIVATYGYCREGHVLYRIVSIMQCGYQRVGGKIVPRID